MRFPRRRPMAVVSTPLPTTDPLRILSEYVLHMSITCLGEHDVTPLYDEYIQDARLGDSARTMAVATHPQSSSIFPRSRSCTMSEIARRPPGFRMRNASANTAGLSGLRLITQLLRTTSAMLSARGIRSMGARTNEVFGARGDRAASRARSTIAGVMSTPMARP